MGTSLRVVCIFSTIGLLCAAYLAGFNSCGSTVMRTQAIGLGAIIFFVGAIASWWRIVQRTAPQCVKYCVVRQMLIFSFALLFMAAITSAAGWVTYTMPRSMSDAVGEFLWALSSPGCP